MGTKYYRTYVIEQPQHDQINFYSQVSLVKLNSPTTNIITGMVLSIYKINSRNSETMVVATEK